MLAGDVVNFSDGLSGILNGGQQVLALRLEKPQPLFGLLKVFERRHIHATLRATGWNKSRTAAILGVERSTLDRKIRRYDLKPPNVRADEWQAE